MFHGYLEWMVSAERQVLVQTSILELNPLEWRYTRTLVDNDHRMPGAIFPIEALNEWQSGTFVQRGVLNSGRFLVARSDSVLF